MAEVSQPVPGERGRPTVREGGGRKAPAAPSGRSRPEAEQARGTPLVRGAGLLCRCFIVVVVVVAVVVVIVGGGVVVIVVIGSMYAAGWL